MSLKVSDKKNMQKKETAEAVSMKYSEMSDESD